MAIDPNISLQGQPAQIDSPLAAMQKFVALRNLIQQAPLQEQQNQITALQLKQQQEDMKDQETMVRIYNDSGGDLLATRKALVGKVSPRSIMAFDQTISNHLKDLAAQEKADIDLNRAKATRLAELSNGMIDGPTYFQGIKQAVSEKVLGEREAQEALSRGFDPDQVKHWQRASLTYQQLSDIDAKDRAESRAEATLAAELPGKEAESAMKVAQAKAMKSMKPEDWNTLVDSVAPPSGNTRGINLRTKSMVNFAIGKGDPKTAQDAVNKARDEVASMERTQLGITARQQATATQNEKDESAIADAIESGLQPPTLTGLYRHGAGVRAQLAKRGFDLTTATKDWTAINQHLKTLNGAQQLRLQQAVNFTYDSLDVLEKLYDDWTKTGLPGGFKDYNKAALIAASHLPGENGAKAQALLTQINDLTSELGTVYKGGNSSTDESLKLAGENLKAEWNSVTFKKAIQLARTNLQLRRNSINSTMTAGMSPGSRYQTSDLEEENPFPEEEK